MTHTPSVSVVVMTHPTRLRLAQEVLGALRGLDPKLVVDPAPWERPSTLRTARLAWEAIAPGATHHLVIQDDVSVSGSFAEHVRNAIRAVPDRPIAFFADWASRNGMAVRFGAVAGARWISGVPESASCVALVMPRAQAEGFVEFAREWSDPDEAEDVMRMYFASAGLRLMLTVPSLVDHLYTRSVIVNDHYRRVAACFRPDMPPGWLRTRELAIEDYEHLPHLQNGRLWLYLRGGATDELRRDLAFEPAAGRVGIDIARAVADYQKMLEARPWVTVREYFELVAPSALWSVWLAGFVLGTWRTLDTWGGIGEAGQPDPEVVEAALISLVLGGIDPAAPPVMLARWRAALVPVVLEGFAAGQIQSLES